MWMTFECLLRVGGLLEVSSSMPDCYHVGILWLYYKVDSWWAESTNFYRNYIHKSWANGASWHSPSRTWLAFSSLVIELQTISVHSYTTVREKVIADFALLAEWALVNWATLHYADQLDAFSLLEVEIGRIAWETVSWVHVISSTKDGNWGAFAIIDEVSIHAKNASSDCIVTFTIWDRNWRTSRIKTISIFQNKTRVTRRAKTCWCDGSALRICLSTFFNEIEIEPISAFQTINSIPLDAVNISSTYCISIIRRNNTLVLGVEGIACITSNTSTFRLGIRGA